MFILAKELKGSAVGWDTIRMSGSDAPTHDELSAMKVDELRNMCGELGLMVSGKKAELIDRILSQYGPEDAEMVGSDISRDIVKDSPETD